MSSTRAIAARLRASAPASGRVVAIRAGQLHVATPSGLQLLPLAVGVAVGDAVRVSEGRVTRASEKPGEVFYL